MKFKAFLDKNKFKIGSIMLICISILCSIFIFSGAYKDLANAAKLSWEFLLHLFNINSSTGGQAPPLPTIPTTPSESGGIILLPENSAIFIAKLRVWGLLYINGGTYSRFFVNLLILLTKAMTITMIVVPIFILIKKVVVLLYMKTNNKHGKDTLPLKAFKGLSRFTITPTVSYTKGFVNYLKDSKILKVLLIIIWVLNLNILSIILPLIPFYIYFCFSFDFTALYEILKYSILNTKYIAILSPFVLVPVGLWIVDKWRQKHAIKRLQGFEEYNQAQLDVADMETCKVGVQGSGKTKNVTNDALSWSVKFTNEAEKRKRICRDMFPHFPWLLFELDIEKGILEERIFNLVTCKDRVIEIESAYNNVEHDLFGYNADLYGMNYYNGIAVEKLFNVLANYAKLHLIYVCQSSFIISNYAIREDKVPMTEGNTIRWNCDFFDFEKDFDKDSYYSKILNFDLLRMGKKIIDNKESNSLEFGILCIAEADKEQKNAPTTLKDSTDSAYANPKNDGITMTEKLGRHMGAEIMGFCFYKELKDSQRVMSVGADARELCTIEHMLRPSKEKNTLPFFFIEKSIMWLANKLFVNFDDEIRYRRGDNTLIHYFLKYIHKKAFDIYYRRKNRFGYKVGTREIEEGTLDSERRTVKMYECNAKLFSDRYKTDSHLDFFENRVRESESGILKFNSYSGTKMKESEQEQQNSYCYLDMKTPNWKEELTAKANAEKEAEKEKKQAEKKAKAEAEREKKKAERKAIAEAEKEAKKKAKAEKEKSNKE